MSAPAGARPAGRRCAPRTFDPTAPRPSLLLVAFFSAGLAMLLGAAVAGVAHAVADERELRWLALHLAMLGGVSQLILGAGQFFVCAFLATSPPSRRLVAAQLVTWNAGTVAVAIGVTASTTVLVDAGAVLVAMGLVLFAGSLRAMERRSLQRARWAVRWYLASAGCLAAGIALGVMLARGTGWSHGSLLGAHLALNLAGWLGTAIVGTLHTFVPSLTATKLRVERLQGPTFSLWVLGVIVLALGAAFDVDGLVVAGWSSLAGAAAGLAVNVAASVRSAPAPLALPARLITLAQVFLVAGIVVALVSTARSGAQEAFIGDARGPLVDLLLVGWIALTVAGALLHLLAVLARIRDLTVAMPAVRPLRDGLLAACLAAAIAARALAHAPGLADLHTPASVVLGAAGLLIAVRIVGLVARVARPARPRHATGVGADRSRRG